MFIAMLKHYIVIALRNFIKYKLQSIVSIVGWQSVWSVLRMGQLVEV